MSKDNLPVLLNYTIMMDPNPLQASTSTSSSYGTITLAVSVPTGATVYCKEIVLYIPSGLLSQKDAFYPEVSTEKWQSPSSKDLTGGRDTGLKTVDVPIKFSAKSSQDYLIDYPLVLTVGVGEITTSLGEVGGLYIRETSSISEEGTYEQRYLPFSLTIGVPDFYVRNFVAGTYDSSNTDITPGGNFKNREAIKLSWEGNATEYQVVTAGGSSPLYSGQNNYYVLEDGLSQTTTFILVASRTDSLRGGTLYLYETLTVHIMNPDDTPKTVSASGNISTTAGLSADTLNVSGLSTLNGGAEITGKLNVTGLSTLADGTVRGTFAVEGESTLAGAAVRGALSVDGPSTLENTTIKGDFSAAGSVGMIGYKKIIDAGTYKAKTDGFVVGNSPRGPFNGWINGGTDGYQVWATSINNLSFSRNSFVFPVRRGGDFWVSHNNFPFPFTQTVYFYFIPIGSGSSGDKVTVKISDEIPKDVILPNVEADSSKEAEQFTQLLEDILGKKIEQEKKEALIGALRRL
ncbi:hypothetical protein AB6A23_13900 [Paenibacillus tarimensis]